MRYCTLTFNKTVKMLAASQKKKRNLKIKNPILNIKGQGKNNG